MIKPPPRLAITLIAGLALIWILATARLCRAQTANEARPAEGGTNASPSFQRLQPALGSFAIMPPPATTDSGAGAGQLPKNFSDRVKSRDRKFPLREDRTAVNLGNKHINAIFGGLEMGASVGFGIEMTTADSIPGVEFRATAISSLRLYRRFEAAAYVPKIGDERTHALVWFDYLRRTKDNFFGIGPRTPEPNETNYDLERRNVAGALYRNFTDRLESGVYISFTNTATYRGQDDKDPPIDQLFSGDPNVRPITRWAPGLLSNVEVFSYGVYAEYDKRNNESGLTKGIYLYGRLGSANGLDNAAFSDYGWLDVELDGRGYIPLGSDRTSLALRAYTWLREPKGGSQIPFYSQPWLGGSRYLRGFQNFRFRGDKSLLFSTELRQTVYKRKDDSGLDVIGFGDAGQVWGDRRSQTDPQVLLNDKFDSGNWRFAIGGGVTFRVNKDFAVRVDLAHTNERNQVYFSISRGF